MLISILQGGLNGLIEYLSAHVLTCLVPAFFIAGAISVFLSQAAILKYFGPQANKWLSYSVASVSGVILSVCSCTVLPLFAGIYKRGAGLGPAVAFLYSGPAINILAIVYTARLLGYDLGIARAIGAILFSIVIGLVMATIFLRGEAKRTSQTFVILPSEKTKSIWKLIIYFALLVGILIFGAQQNWSVTGTLIAALLIILWRWFTKEEVIDWLKSTGYFVKMILPWLLGGVFIAGILKVVIPESVVTGLVGSNSLQANALASVSGALMYFATLTEVPILRSFMDLGMSRGPALALLLAGPALSLPAMLTLRSIMGVKKTAVYVLLTAIMATFCGFLFGIIK
ncbi:hypothetical protein ES703_61130 [subsurface metagenome]